MKDIINKTPKKYLIFLAALAIIILIGCCFILFTREPPVQIVTKESTLPPHTEEIVEQKFVDYSKFGVVHIEVSSPSYAQSNFDVNPETAVTVYFNKEVDPQELAGNFSLINKITNRKVTTQVTFQMRGQEDEQSKYTWKWQEVWQQKLIFTPDSKLEPITRYSAEILAGYTDITGQDVAQDNFQFEFMTADVPGVLSTNLDDGAIRSNDAIKVFFKSPMDTGGLEEGMSLTPLPENLSYTNNDKVLVIENTFEVGSTYTLLIPYDTKDIYGRNLGEDAQYVFTVQ